MTRTRPGGTPARPPDEQSTRTPARADVRLMPIGEPVRPLPHGGFHHRRRICCGSASSRSPRSSTRSSRGPGRRDALVAAGLMQVAARSAAGRLGIRHPRVGAPRGRLPWLGRPCPRPATGTAPARRRPGRPGRPAGVVRPGGRHRASRWRGHDHGGRPAGGPHVVDQPYWARRVAGCASARHRRSDRGHRVPVGRGRDGPGLRDPRAREGRGRHHPHRRSVGALRPCRSKRSAGTARPCPREPGPVLK